MSETIDKIQAQIFQQMTPQQRFQLGMKMIEDGFKIMDWRLQREMPESTLSERQAKRFEQLYASDLSPEVMRTCLKGLKRYWDER